MVMTVKLMLQRRIGTIKSLTFHSQILLLPFTRELFRLPKMRALSLQVKSTTINSSSNFSKNQRTFADSLLLFTIFLEISMFFWYNHYVNFLQSCFTGWYIGIYYKNNFLRSEKLWQIYTKSILRQKKPQKLRY